MKYLIYNTNTYETYTNKDLIESILYNDDTLTEADVTDAMIEDERGFLAAIDYENEIMILDRPLDNDILIIANLGLWSGRKTGYKILDNNLKSILNAGCGDYYKVEYNGFNVVATDSHHDGTNYYTFRKIKDPDKIEILLDKLYNGTATNSDINRYTKSLRDDIKAVYGW
jgi:hypothetical protein